MEGFIIKGDNGFLKIEFFEVFGFPNETCHFGGYDTKSIVEINSGSFKVKSGVYCSTGEIFEFYEQLLKTNEQLKGSAYLRNYEHNLNAEVKYDINGRVTIFGSFREVSEFNNLLEFEFSSDQSYIQQTLIDLKKINLKYGGLKGVK